ncbi:hypothetical protein CRG98_017702 [Punica granatum]|uniref:Malectin-like domain-containing protein n=1 Tax=Punica granatum TaxID=22663 RepID=A0A2I0K2P3_PUNGR|nr:hypothetical protein CRG98_017702 [Punica granatum]
MSLKRLPDLFLLCAVEVPSTLPSITLKFLLGGDSSLNHSVLHFSKMNLLGDDASWLAQAKSIHNSFHCYNAWDNRGPKNSQNKQLSNSSYLSGIEQLNPLCVFTEQNKNHYILPVTTSRRYFIKEAFHYGNYDGLSQAPTFDLKFDGNKWTTVSTNFTNIVP